MSRTWSIRLQTALVIALFLGSLAAVLFNTFQSLILPQRDFGIRERLRAASQRMAVEAASVTDRLGVTDSQQFNAINERLRAVTNDALSGFPGVEGGFYLEGKFGGFAGYGFPADQSSPPAIPGMHAPLPQPSPAALGKSEPRRPPPRPGDQPPPKETPFILVQAEHSLSLDSGEYQFDVRTVGPSRGAILTEAVGETRPARLATWTMFRVTSPESVADQLRRFQLSTGLALGGIALALVLTVNLGRTLKRQRADQERLQDELRRTEHLAVLGKLLAGVAHEVRNPLAGIRSTVQLWERLPATASSPESIHTIIRAVDRLNEIVSRLLYFARVENAECEPVAVNSVLIETLDLLEAQAGSQSVVIARELDGSLPAVAGSANALRQVFLNLATNAFQAMPRGGTLRCSSRYDPRNRRVEIRFSDTGTGISTETRQQLFEPFFTTRPNGTGLGLALCREIIVQHGGEIELETTGGSGTSFRITLPAID